MASEMNVSPLEFLRALWGDTEGWAELTTISKAGVKSFPFHYPDGISAFLPAAANHNKNANVYMGVTLRKEKWPRPSGKVDAQGKPVLEWRGTEQNAQTSWAVWAEFDFAGHGHKGKTVEESVARKALKEFPFKPSVVNKSGGGIQVFWFLKEPAEGQDLARVKAINKALCALLGADTQSVDLARILRVPGLLNLKYDPPRKVEISWWKPDNRYLLDDFEDLLNVDKSNLPVLGADPQAPQPPAGRPVPEIALSEEAIAELGLALANLWKDGYKHKTEQDIGGMFAWAGIRHEDAAAIMEAASNSVGGNTADRLKGLKGTYDKYCRGDAVTGRRHFQEMRTDLSYPAQQKAALFLDAFDKLVASAPKPAPKVPVAGPEESPSISKLQISDYAKKTILEGHQAYVDFRRNTETPAKFKQLKDDGKMTRTEADCWIATNLIQAGVSEQTIHAIFRDKTNLISQKAYEREATFEDYIGSVIREVQRALKAQPKWQPTSIAQGASKQVDQGFEDELFRVKRVLKFDQEPPTYDVTLVMEGIEYSLKCSLDQAYKYEFFSKAFFAKFNRHLPTQKESTWQKMYQAAEQEMMQIEKEEGTFEGQMDIVINLLEETAVDVKSADISINHSAVRTKEGNVVFKTPIIQRMLKDRFSDAKKHDVIHYLKSAGWNYIQKRLGKRNDWIWMKISGNGNGQGNGHPPSNGHPPDSHPPKHHKTPPAESKPVGNSPDTSNDGHVASRAVSIDPMANVVDEPKSDMVLEMDLPGMGPGVDDWLTSAGGKEGA